MHVAANWHKLMTEPVRPNIMLLFRQYSALY